MEYTQYGKGYGAVPADSSTRTRVTLALALRGQGSFNATNQHLNARELFAYLAVAGGTQYADRYVAATPNSELIGIFDGHVVECFEKDEHQRVLRLLEEAKTVLAPTTTLAKTPSQVVDNLEAFVRHCGFKEKGDGTLEELSEGRQGDWRNPSNVVKFLKEQCAIVGVPKTWVNWKKKPPPWAPLTDSGNVPKWGSKPPYWLAATAAAHELIDARERLDGVSDEVRDTEKKAAKQAAFTRYFHDVADKLTEFEVAALEGLSDAKIMERVARRAKALDARISDYSSENAHASVAAGSVPKAQAAKKKADAQSIAQGTNLSAPRKKKAGGLVPYNAEDGFARQRDRKGFFEPADARDWLG